MARTALDCFNVNDNVPTSHADASVMKLDSELISRENRMDRTNEFNIVSIE